MIEKKVQDSLSDFFKIPVGIYWIGPDGTILKCSQNELALLGYSWDELVGKNMSTIHFDKKEIEDILQKAKMGVEVNRYQTQLRCKDGSVRHALLNTAAHRENGKFIHSRFFVRDITEQKRSELTNALLGAIIDSSNDAIISKDLNGTIISWNDGAEHIFGFTAAEIIGQSNSKIVSDEYFKVEEDILGRVKKGERVNYLETIRKHKNGSPLNISLSISPIRDSAETIVGISEISRDITQNKQAEARLVTYKEQLRTLVAKLNKSKEQARQHFGEELHDNLAQLITMSKIKLDQLKKKANSKNLAPEIDELGDLINESNRHISKLMSELKPPPVLEEEHFKTALDWVANKMKQYNLKVIIEDDKKLKPLSDDVKTVLFQSVKELLHNVVKHTDVKKAYVSVLRRDDQIQIEIIDKGVGFKMDENELDAGSGGFGLFNIEERMDQLGGSFTIHSEPGKGTTATLTAPLKEVEKFSSPTPEDEQAEVEIAEKNMKKINVLVADDHQIMREGIRKLIEAENDMIVIAEAANGNEAVEAARKTFPDVIIMDINMPVMNGIEATKKILSTNGNPIVIGLSVHNSEYVGDSIKEAGAVEYLSKQEMFDLLCITIRSEFKAKQSTNGEV